MHITLSIIYIIPCQTDISIIYSCLISLSSLLTPLINLVYLALYFSDPHIVQAWKSREGFLEDDKNGAK